MDTTDSRKTSETPVTRRRKISTKKKTTTQNSNSGNVIVLITIAVGVLILGIAFIVVLSRRSKSSNNTEQKNNSQEDNDEGLSKETPKTNNPPKPTEPVYPPEGWWWIISEAGTAKMENKYVQESSAVGSIPFDYKTEWYGPTGEYKSVKLIIRFREISLFNEVRNDTFTFKMENLSSNLRNFIINKTPKNQAASFGTTSDKRTSSDFLKFAPSLEHDELDIFLKFNCIEPLKPGVIKINPGSIVFIFKDVVTKSVDIQ